MSIIKKEAFENPWFTQVPGSSEFDGTDYENDEDDIHEISSGQIDYFQRIATTLEELTSIDGPVAPIVKELVRVSLFRVLGEIDRTELIESAVTKAFDDVELAFAISLHVSPSDHEIAERQMRDVRRSVPVHSDPLLSPGEIVVETPKGRIHIGASEQALALIEAIDQGWHDGSV